MTENQLEIKPSGIGPAAIGCFLAIFGVLAFGLVAVQIKDGGGAGMVFGLGVGLSAVFGTAFWLARRAYQRRPRYFTDAGVVRNDGSTLPWSDLSHVVHQVRVVYRRTQSKQLWRTEIHFKNGEAVWLVPNYVGNLDEALAFVAKLPCEHKEVVVGALH
jgi:hypothetical protein